MAKSCLPRTETTLYKARRIRPNMIISFVLGGLGNQCFQYALGRQLGYLQHEPLKLESFGYRFSKYARHPYLLDKFNIVAGKAHLVDYLRLGARNFGPSVITAERSLGFHSKVLNIRHSTVLIGYWQSEKYFPDVAHLIREELTLKDSPSPATRDMAAHIRATESIAVHVRRTDYVSNPKNIAMFEQCSTNYYRAAMHMVAERVQSPRFFVFSDDPLWTKANIQCDCPITYVTHNDQSNAHEDLMLMRYCKHNIIANSTLGWWGGWLNDNPHKMVVTPRKWFKNDSGWEEDLLPAAWIRL